MSGGLVSRCSVSRLWSELEALESWKATLAVSYVSLAACVCCTCSILGVQQQSVLWLNACFSRVTLSLEIFGPLGGGAGFIRVGTLTVFPLM